jgi:hypothetical protein
MINKPILMALCFSVMAALQLSFEPNNCQTGVQPTHKMVNFNRGIMHHSETQEIIGPQTTNTSITIYFFVWDDDQ